ncbi:trimeric intracellular cation channel family protein [Faecalibacter macacae]|uniref:Trimeric intracellular cation channel family protein n=1 Tax=Faecalibacter macacae TaxID=1859289 RepID=A0A3L9MI55_9FLAO|nr:trimeric intracellular cation channel family protein [Faecalibacter macacae]RLZ11826.1 trimeric intracellular cation channel family protein [Faecalibacter macacae]
MQIQYIFELIGTLAFAISGAMAGDERQKHDWFGITFIAFITAIGGGTLRDLFLNSYPLVWFNDMNIIYTIFLGILLPGLFYKYFVKLRTTLMLFDTLGIALFTIVGLEKAQSLGANDFISVVMGMFTAVMGGVIRDTMINKTPTIFVEEIYATACIIGGITYLILDDLGIDRNINFIISGSLIAVIRIIAVKFNLSLPKFYK